ncbi:MAG TPA: HD domain-containing phosphohydrolase [Verrucomicrobiae bacterium]
MKTSRILFVDDDPNVLSAYQRTLRKRYTLDTASSGDAGLALMEKDGPYAVIVADMQMPGMNGVDFLKHAMQKSPDSVRLMLTGNADQKTAADAVNHGHVFSFLSKPCPAESLEAALENALRQYQLICAEKELLEETLNGSIKVLTDILAIVDPEAFGHAQRLREEIRGVAKWFGVPRAWEYELGAMLSQIGTVAIPPTVLARHRTGQGLSPTEKEMIASIPEIGANLIANIPRMAPVAEIVRYQRKNFDGSGFPNDAVAGENIPMGARILRVLADLVRVEAGRKTRAEAFVQLKLKTGVYDPKVLDAVASSFDLYLGAEQAEIKNIPLSELKAGDVLASDILTKDGTLVVGCGAQISGALLRKLQNFREVVGLQEPLMVFQS